MISSRKPTNIILKIPRKVSINVKLSLIPDQRFVEAIKAKGK
jgi:hypothetical protein